SGSVKNRDYLRNIPYKTKSKISGRLRSHHLPSPPFRSPVSSVALAPPTLYMTSCPHFAHLHLMLVTSFRGRSAPTAFRTSLRSVRKGPSAWKVNSSWAA
ncbi:hypothetical protein CEP51_016831, partial [Fusarium floridanum]